MRLITRSLAAAALAAGLLACADSAAPPSNEQIAQGLLGFWADTNLVAGSYFRIFLSPDGSQLTGSGAFGVEAGVSGSVAVTGFVASREDIELDIVYSTGGTRHFRGSLTPLGKLSGVWYSVPAGAPSNVTLVPVIQDPP